jgi:phenylacetate-CoA ligase
MDPNRLSPVAPGEAGELILTPLGRVGSPLLRYRTGDLVRAAQGSVCSCGRSDLALEGGILGRTDDMITVRGINVYPSAVEGILRQFEEVAEYQVMVSNAGAMVELSVRVEKAPDGADGPDLAARIENAFQTLLHLRVPVQTVAEGSLPRFEMKGRRWNRL